MTTYQPGSFFLVNVTGPVGWLIGTGQALAGDPSRYEHAGIVIDSEGTTVEAAPGGAFYGHLSAYTGRALLVSDGPVQQELAQYDRGELYWDQTRDDLERHLRLTVTAEAHNLIGTPYSALDYFALAALHLHLPSRWIRQRVESSKHMQCAQLVDAAYQRAGIHLFQGKFPGDVMPSDLAAYAEDHLQ